MMYDHFSTASSAIPDVIVTTSSISSSLLSLNKKKTLPITTATKSETTAHLQANNTSNKFMSWMIPAKRIPDTTDTLSISSKKSSSTASILSRESIDIDVNKLYEYATKDMCAFGYPLPAYTATLEIVTKSVTPMPTTPALVNTTPTTTTATLGNTTITPTTTITSSNSTLDGMTGQSQKAKVTEIFDKASTTSKPLEKER